MSQLQAEGTHCTILQTKGELETPAKPATTTETPAIPETATESTTETESEPEPESEERDGSEESLFQLSSTRTHGEGLSIDEEGTTSKGVYDQE